MNLVRPEHVTALRLRPGEEQRDSIRAGLQQQHGRRSRKRPGSRGGSLPPGPQALEYSEVFQNRPKNTLGAIEWLPKSLNTTETAYNTLGAYAQVSSLKGIERNTCSLQIVKKLF